MRTFDNKRRRLKICSIRMMLVFAFILIGTVPSFAQSADKQISLECNNEPLADALKKIEKASGFKVLFTYDEVQSYKVTASIKRQSVSKALQIVLRSTSLKYSVKGKFINVTASHQLQQNQKNNNHRAMGQVVDENGEPLIGVTVRVKGTNEGALTDVNGNFSVSVNESNSTLLFSYIGKKNLELNAHAGHKISITLEDAVNALNDVVVTGYQTISRERSAGSFNIIKGESVSSRLATTGNILQSMEGLATGLNINMNSESDPYVVRGVTSINSDRSPLFVVDGIPLEATQVDALLNGNDIKSVSLLKDATAASIWGTQAANGVIVITTKNGTKNQKLRISYQGSYSYTGKPDYNYQHKMSTKDYLRNAQEMFDLYSDTYTYDKVKTTLNGLSGQTNNPIVLPHERLMYQYKNGEISLAERDAALAKLVLQDGRSDYEKYFMSNKMATRHTLSFSGGSDKNIYFLSLGYVGEQGIEKDWNNRFSINAKNEFILTPWLKWDITVNASYLKNSKKLSPWKDYDNDKLLSGSSSYWDVPYATLYDEQGKEVDYSVYSVSAEKRASVEALTGVDMSFYPIQDFNRTSSKTIGTNIRLNSGFTIDLIRGLKYEGRVQYSRFYSKTENYYPSTMWKIREEQLCATSLKTPKVCNLPVTGGNYIMDNSITNDWTIRNQVTFNHDFQGGLHQLTVLAGTEVREYKYMLFNNFLRGYDMQTMKYTAYDDKNFTRLTNAVMGASINNFNTQYYTQTEMKRRYFSLYGNAAYTFDGKYSLNASIRVDQSNLFGSDPNDQYQPIWSVGLGWNIKQESFMKHLEWLNRFSIRATYGYAGNSPKPGQGGNYDILTAVSTTMFENNGYSITSPSNKKITWEKTRTWNIGFDATLINNRVNISFDYYNKKTTDLISNMLLNPTTGWSSVVGNVGSLSNRGYELSIGSHNIQSGDFNWYTTLTLSHNSNKITKLNVATPFTAETLTHYSSQNKEGYPINSLFSYRYAGLNEKGEPQAYDKNGKIVSGVAGRSLTADDAVYSGTIIPKLYGALTNSFTYKDWNVSFMLIYNFGNKMRKQCENFSYGRPIANMLQDFDKRWRSVGDEKVTNIPTWTVAKNSASYNDLYYYADCNILNASYIKLRELSIGYRIPKSICHALSAESVNLKLQVGNLFYWAANHENIDPEYYSLEAYYGNRTNKFGPTYAIEININF